MSKDSAENVDLMFMHEYHANFECYKTTEEVENGLASASNEKGIIKVLRNNIVTHAKGLGWSECHTPWSINGKQHSVDCLKRHLMHIVTDSTLKNEQATAPVMNFPSRKDLPTLGNLTVDVRSKKRRM